MKTQRIYFLGFIFQTLFSYSLLAQIDTLESLSYFPMHIGDTWEYRYIQWPSGVNEDTVYNWYNFTWSIVGDTIMPNSKKYFVFNDNRYLRIDTTKLCVYEYEYEDEFELFFLYCCIDTEIVINDWGTRYFSTEMISAGLMQVCRSSVLCETYDLLRYWGMKWYMYGEGGPPFEMYLTGATVNGQVLDYENSISNEQNTLFQYQLGNNYPNPFNITTTIPYEIKRSGKVKISIFNIRGNLVDVILDKYHNIGKYSIKWNASGFSSGIYIYNLEMNNFLEHKKCILIK